MAEKRKRAKAKPKLKPKQTRTSAAQSSKELKLLRRQTFATDLRTQGMTYRRLAKRLIELGIADGRYGEALAYKDVKDYMAGITGNMTELALQNLYIDLRRMDEMFERVWPLALPKPEAEGEIELPPDPVYFGAVLEIMARRAILLNYKSLYEPKEQGKLNYNVNPDDYSTAELIELMQRLQSGEDPLVAITSIQNKRSERPKQPEITA